MELATTFANNFLILLDAMAIYILIGLLIAGILKQLVPNDFVIKHLGKGSICYEVVNELKIFTIC